MNTLNFFVANSATPAFAAGILHLIIGNLFIGIGEGLLIAMLWNQWRGRLICGLMIIANYVSAWIGFLLLLAWGKVAAQHVTVENLILTLILTVGVAFVLSILLEWPFVRWALRRRAWSVSIVACVIAQMASYALLVPFYLGTSDLSLVRAADIRPVAQFARNETAWIYYMDIPGGNVYRIRPSGLQQQLVAQAAAPARGGRLEIQRQSEDAHWSLVKVTGRDASEIIIEAFVQRSAPEWRTAARPNNWTGVPRDLRERANRTWRVTHNHAGDGPGGLKVHNSGQGRTYSLSLDTPLVSWVMHSMTVLPADQVVFELSDIVFGEGADQIVLLDLPSQRLGLITRGSGPLVVLEEDLVNAPAQ